MRHAAQRATRTGHHFHGQHGRHCKRIRHAATWVFCQLIRRRHRQHAGEHSSRSARSRQAGQEPAKARNPNPGAPQTERFDASSAGATNAASSSGSTRKRGSHEPRRRRPRDPGHASQSLVALGMLFLGMAQGRRAYYTAPIRRSSRKFFDPGQCSVATMWA